MHRTMADMMKAMGGAKRGPMAGLAQMMGFGGGMPSPEEIAKLAEKMPGGCPPAAGLPGLRRLPAAAPAEVSRLPGRLPGLGGEAAAGFPGLGKKKSKHVSNPSSTLTLNDGQQRSTKGISCP